ncbi:PD40 domain-containing protein [Sporosarcina sp. HYO08]|uniref:TolB family protein n=1 Tax=Sporosarcina sp. HYO08 TaxID=1759557 RepID=UPI0007967318|nr:PD40 domain-containing protein [Sporosarcina sp. HYO08]KXH80074.1 hypothetical protein AU377_11415 [Sporosarcina sp. HYO08]
MKYFADGTLNARVDPPFIQQRNLPSNVYSHNEQTDEQSTLDHGGFIAYNSNRSGANEIWTYNVRTGENEQLTQGLGDAFSQPIWAPNSRRIAFTGKNRIVYIIYLDSGSIAAIDQLPKEGDLNVSWSPDNESIAYVKRGTITIYDTTLHEARTINAAGATDVQWFPTGTVLLYQAMDDKGNSQLYQISVNGRDRKKLTNNSEGPIHHIRLSPDGLFVVYTTPGESVSLIRTMELATGTVFPIKGGPLSKNYYPVWSPDSTQIAFTSTIEDHGYSSQIRTIGRKGKAGRIWAISSCYATPVTWAPDGKKIAYLSGCRDEHASNELWILQLNRSKPMRVIQDQSIMSLQWSPTEIEDLTMQEYTNELLGINLQYPHEWTKINEVRFEGGDGFFQVGALFGTETMQQICQAEAHQKLMPYGSDPQIRHLEMPVEACLIYPSNDQSEEMKGQAAYITKYEAPIEIEGKSYNYFILWADKDHIEKIVSTLLFLP